MILERLRNAWTGSSRHELLTSQRLLLGSLVRHQLASGEAVLNYVDSGPIREEGATVVLAHGFGSGLGFFFKNVDPLLDSGTVKRVVMFDWLGMGGSARPDCRQSPRLGFLPSCNSKFTTSQAVDFFIDPLEEFCDTLGLDKFTLVGHSLGGYLSLRYAVKHPNRVEKLVLASPVGFPAKPEDALRKWELPAGLMLIDALWSANFTPQQIVRLMGSQRGRRTIKRVLGMRIPHLNEQDVEYLADYLYHVTVAKASGEFAMNSLLVPVRSPTAVGVFAREPLSAVVQDLNVPRVSVLYGDHDWMRPNEHSARDSMHRLATLKGSQADVHILPTAGHHLYMDNPNAFHQHILH